MFKIILIIANLFFLINSIRFEYEIHPGKIVCFGDSLGALINVVSEVDSSSEKLIIRVYDQKGKALFNKTSSEGGFSTIAFTTEDDGNIQFCFGNQGDEPAKFRFKYNTGVDAKDYSELTKKADIQPLELQIRKMEDMMQTIKREMRFLVMREGQRIANVEDISYKILGFSLISLGLITLLSMFQLTYLKEFFKKKKLI